MYSIYVYVFYASKKPSDKVIYYYSGGGDGGGGRCGSVGRERGPAAARVITRESGAAHRSDRICPSIIYNICTHISADIIMCGVELRVRCV